MLDFDIINIATIIAVIFGGFSMGVYLSYAADSCRVPSLVTLVVMGWSFLIPLGITQVFLDEDGVDVQRVAERMALWFLFSIHARVGARYTCRVRLNRLKK